MEEDNIVVPSDHSEEILEELQDIKELLTSMTTEEIMEEETEVVEIDPSTLPVSSGEYKEGVETINENLGQIAEGIKHTNEFLENSTIEETTEEVTEHEIVYGSGTIADSTLYFADKVENANLNDVYSMLWSVRNVILMFMFLVLFVLLYKAFKNLIYRFTN